VIVRKFSRDWCAGMRVQASPNASSWNSGLTGKVCGWLDGEVGLLCGDFLLVSDQVNPERLQRRRFSTRPGRPGYGSSSRSRTATNWKGWRPTT